MPRSIRGKAVLGSGAAIAAFGLSIGVGAYAVVTQAALTSARAALATQVSEVSDQLTEQARSGPDTVDLEALRASTPTFIQIVSPSGAILAASPGLQASDRICPQPTPLDPIVDRVSMTLAGSQGGFLRATAPVATPGGTVVVCAVTSDQVIGQAQEAVLRTLLIALPLLVLGVGIVGWVSLGRALRAVDDMTSQAEAMQSTADGELRVRRTGDEIERLGHTFNALLTRLHHQTRATRQFVADAGHELRNPLSTLRVTLEFAQDADEAGLRSSALRALRELDRLEVLVQDLLVLARTDARDIPVEVDDIDLAALVAEGVSASKQNRPDLTFRFEYEPCWFRANRPALRSLMANLLDNAARHTRTSVDVSVTVSGGETRIQVVDDGDGLSPEDCERVFERFVRLDESRDRDEGGSGLGLAIVASIAESHGGRAFAAPGPGGHFTITLRDSSSTLPTP